MHRGSGSYANRHSERRAHGVANDGADRHGRANGLACANGLARAIRVADFGTDRLRRSIS